MVRGVIHHMQDDLPQRGCVRIAFQVFVRGLGLNILVRQRRGPLLPALVQSWPFSLERFQLAVLVGDESCRGFTVNPVQPNAIRGEGVRQGADHAFVGGLEVTREFGVAEFCGGIEYATGGPGAVVEMKAESIGGDGHIPIMAKFDFGRPVEDCDGRPA